MQNIRFITFFKKEIGKIILLFLICFITSFWLNILVLKYGISPCYHMGPNIEYICRPLLIKLERFLARDTLYNNNEIVKLQKEIREIMKLDKSIIYVKILDKTGKTIIHHETKRHIEEYFDILTPRIERREISFPVRKNGEVVGGVKIGIEEWNSEYKIFVKWILVIMMINLLPVLPFIGYLIYKKKTDSTHDEDEFAIASGLAHEIRNPLNAINFNLKLIEKKIEGKDVELLKKTREEVNRLNNLVANYLQFASIISKEKKRVDLNEIVEGVIGFLTPTFKSCGINIIKKLSTNTIPIIVDESGFRQILINIFENAREALSGKENGVVVVSSYIENNMAVCSVMDNGKGIEEEILPKIFDPFFSQREKGTGLGLAIARRFIESYNGKIKVHSEPNKGSTFTIYIPLAK